MPNKENVIQDIESIPIDEEEQETSSRSGGAKFLSYGKYFLVVLVLAIQILLAYTIVDKNYEQIYGMLNVSQSEEIVEYQFEELIVNPAGTNGHRFLVVEIALELSDIEHQALIEEHKQEIVHNMLAALSTRTIDQLIRLQEREVLRNELKEIINSVIGVRSVRNLYYTKYIMQ